MTKLTDTQLIILSKAAQRDDGAAVLPEKMTKATASKIAGILVARKLMREVRAKPGMPVWRTDEHDRPISLVILKAGRAAIGVEDDAHEEAPSHAVAKAPSKASAAPRRASVTTPAEAPAPIMNGAAMPRSGSKQALVISMLSADAGATLEALVAATGWLPHTTRAALTCLRKRGFIIERYRAENATASTYRIVKDAAKAA